MKYLLFHTAGDEFLRKNIFDILDEAARYDNFTEQHLIGCLILGFIYVIRRHSKKFRTNTSQALNLSDNFSIKSCLQKNLETITLRELANHLNLPVSNCSRLIKSSTGFNFSEWQKNLLEILGLGRRKKILEKLKQDHRVYVSELSKLFDVTEETIRRDLDKLEEEDLVKRDYGGAVLNSYISEDLSFLKRSLINGDLKNIIAQKAHSLIDDDSTIMMDSSTTCLTLLNLLRFKKNLTIITNSIRLAYDFSGAPFRIISVGGNLRGKSFALPYLVAKVLTLSVASWNPTAPNSEKSPLLKLATSIKFQYS